MAAPKPGNPSVDSKAKLFEQALNRLNNDKFYINLTLGQIGRLKYALAKALALADKYESVRFEQSVGGHKGDTNGRR